jgi:hypothetical protein
MHHGHNAFERERFVALKVEDWCKSVCERGDTVSCALTDGIDGPRRNARLRSACGQPERTD